MILKMKNIAKKLELDEHFGVSAWENVTNLSIQILFYRKLMKEVFSDYKFAPSVA